MRPHPHLTVTDPTTLLPAQGPVRFNRADWTGMHADLVWARHPDGTATLQVYDDRYLVVPVLEDDRELVALVGHGLELHRLAPDGERVGRVASAMFEANPNGSGTWLAYTSDVLDGGPSRSDDHPVVAFAQLLFMLG